MSQKMLILVDGKLDIFTAKTAVSLIRYRPGEVVAVLDRAHAGQDLEAIVGIGHGIPIVASVEESLAHNPDTFVIGVAPPGGQLPDAWAEYIRHAIEAKMNIVSGLHTYLSDRPEFSELAALHDVQIQDIRKTTEDFGVGMARAASTAARRILTVGTDCNLGKKLTALEITGSLRSQDKDAVFLPTGQTGIMIAGWGIAIDSILSDYVSGASEKMVLDHADAEFLVAEGQGALVNPSYSGVTLGLMHGVLPHDMILCHAPQRTTIRHLSIPMPPLAEHIQLHEAVMKPLFPSKVVGIALNCFGMAEDEIQRAVEAAESETELPATDCVRFGAAKLAQALLDRIQDPIES